MREKKSDLRIECARICKQFVIKKIKTKKNQKISKNKKKSQNKKKKQSHKNQKKKNKKTKKPDKRNIVNIHFFRRL